MDTKRVIAWIIDFFITGFIQMLLMVLFIIKPLIEFGNDYYEFNILIRQIIITYCSVSYLILRDIIGRKSIGKNIIKLSIVNKKDGKTSNIIKKFIRNITWLLGPIEIIIYIITKERLGDKIAGTKIVNN